MWGSGVLEVRKSGVFREVLGGQEAWKSGGLNSRIVTIIFETENLFFPRAEAIRLFLLGNPGRPRLCAWLGQCSEGGLRVVWGRSGRTGFSDSRSRPALSQPGPGLRLSRRVCPAGCRRRPVRVPVPRPARAGPLPRCAGAARRLSGRRLPLCPGNRLPAAATSRLKRFSPVPAGVLPAAQPPPPTPPPCAGPARRSRPVSTLPRAAAPGGPARVGGVGPLGPFPPGAGMAPLDLPAAPGQDGWSYREDWRVPTDQLASPHGYPAVRRIPGRAAGPAYGSPGSPRSGPSRWSSWHSLDWRILRPAGPAGGAPRNWPTGFPRTREPWGSSE